MLVQRPHLLYEGADRQSLAEGARLLAALVVAMNMDHLERVAAAFRGSRWLAMDTITRLMQDDPLELTVGEAYGVKSALEVAMKAHKLDWSSPVAVKLAPVLRDLATIALQERDAREAESRKVRVVRAVA